MSAIGLKKGTCFSRKKFFPQEWTSILKNSFAKESKQEIKKLVYFLVSENIFAQFHLILFVVQIMQ